MTLAAIDSGLAWALVPGLGQKTVDRAGGGRCAERMAAPAAIVGREREVSCLTEALRGDARLMLVLGDAGMGKTRLVEEGMARAGAAGMVMIRGECLPVAGMLPLLPITAALGELARLDGGGLMEAALDAAPGFVRAEVGRLVPQLGPGGGPGADALGEGWQRQRLFAGLAQLLGAVAVRSRAGVGLVVEDVHWADSETLDFLTFLGLAGCRDAVSVVVTCRTDEAPVGAQVADWLAQVRGAAGLEELTLAPLSRAEVAGQVAALTGAPAPPGVVDELFRRAEGNPFFTQQLVAAALAEGAAEGVLRVPAVLPGRLAGLLAARAGRCAGEARAVLDALAVAGRPLGEDLLGEITGLEPEVIRRGLRELAAARLLADDAPGGGHRPRNALLAEAITGALLSGERAVLNERTARALEGAGHEALAREAAEHRQRAIGLWPDIPDAASAAFPSGQTGEGPTAPPGMVSGAAAAVPTPRELDVLKLVAQGLSNAGIARRLVLSEHTVHRHLANILRKLDLSSRTAAAAWAVRAGLV
jgi:DNA-binding CsgD family transcriptional regulator